MTIITVQPGPNALAAAYSRVAPGDTLLLADGDYGDQSLTLTSTLSGADPVTIKPMTGATPRFRQLDLSGVRDIVTERLFAQILFLGGVDNVRILGGELGPWTNDVCKVWPGSTSVSFEGVLFHDFIRTIASQHMEALHVAGGVQGLKVIGCSFWNTAVMGLFIEAYDFGPNGTLIDGASGARGQLRDIEIRDNTFPDLSKQTGLQFGYEALKFQGANLRPGPATLTNVVVKGNNVVGLVEGFATQTNVDLQTTASNKFPASLAEARAAVVLPPELGGNVPPSPPAPPVPPPTAPSAAQLIDQALAELKLTTVGYTNTRWTVPPAGTHWARAFALLAQAKAAH